MVWPKPLRTNVIYKIVPAIMYHTIRNVLYMAMTEFTRLSEPLDWVFMREKRSQIAFLFGVDDHWDRCKCLRR
ncbi:hypothetical protein CK203_116239 [Vitis vinifera]|uniref:Uncharacterized protein n=1 Tax=Vitis vinifera TaxID=29760 RepID=A0A438EA08_VITVI|nr:hypothetical protein CK203_116239 [Vitis vinifera]